MSAAHDVTREEFDLIKATIDRLGIQLEVLSRDNQYLHQRLADLSETVNERFDEVDARFDQVDARFDRMDTRFDQMERLITEGHATLLAVMGIKPH